MGGFEGILLFLLGWAGCLALARELAARGHIATHWSLSWVFQRRSP
jgi:hypothetical protein